MIDRKLKYRLRRERGMKKEYTLEQQFAVVALDGLSCIHHSAAKYAALRGIAAAKYL